KYGERAFRYCQHDVGHAIGALRLSAARLGWQMRLLTGWSDPDIESVLGLDRDADYGDAERETAECIAIVTPGEATDAFSRDWGPLVAAARAGAWTGRANALSPSRVEWALVDQAAGATRRDGAG